MIYINNIHITEFESFDNKKDYHNILINLKTPEDFIILLHHIHMTTPVFGEWNIIKDNILPPSWIEILNSF